MKFNKTILLIPLLFFLLFSCCEKENSNDIQKPRFREDALETISEILDKKFQTWKSYSTGLNPDFSFDDFHLDTSIAIKVSYTYDSLPVNNKFEKQYYYNYSFDSTKAVDIYSYNASLVSNKNGKIEVLFDVDTEVRLIDFTKIKTYRLFFSGPSQDLNDVAWISNSSFIITGYIEVENQNMSDPLFQPEILYFDLLKREIKVYKNHAVKIKRSGLNYYSIKFPNIESTNY